MPSPARDGDSGEGSQADSQPERLHAAAEAAIRLADILNALALRVALVETATSDAGTVHYVERLAILVDSAAAQLRRLLDALRNGSPDAPATASRIPKVASRPRAKAVPRATAVGPHGMGTTPAHAATAGLHPTAGRKDKPRRADKKPAQETER